MCTPRISKEMVLSAHPQTSQTPGHPSKPTYVRLYAKLELGRRNARAGDHFETVSADKPVPPELIVAPCLASYAPGPHSLALDLYLLLVSKSRLPGSLDMSNPSPPTGSFIVSAPKKLEYFRKRGILFNTVEICAHKAEVLTNELHYAQGWLAITKHVISTQFTTSQSMRWAHVHFEDLRGQLFHHSDSYAIARDRSALYPVSLSFLSRGK